MATVNGPASSTDKAIARWNGTAGDTIQDSPVIVDDAGNITGVASFENSANSSTIGTPLTVNTVNSNTGGILINGVGDLDASSLFLASLSSSINADFSVGSATGTAEGGASISGGFLDCTGNSGKAVTWAAAGNANLAYTGCFRFNVKPNYSGTPPATYTFFFNGISGSVNSRIQITHNSSGHLLVSIADPSGAPVTTDLGAWSPTAATVYEFEYDFDVAVGSPAQRLFIDGVQFGSTRGHCIKV